MVYQEEMLVPFLSTSASSIAIVRIVWYGLGSDTTRLFIRICENSQPVLQRLHRALLRRSLPLGRIIVLSCINYDELCCGAD